MARSDSRPDANSVVFLRLFSVVNDRKFNPNWLKYKINLLAHLIKKARTRGGIRYCGK